MDPKEAFVWAVYYRGLSALAMLGGGALVLAGLAVGLDGDVQLLLREPSAALDGFASPAALGLGLLGVILWQVGTTMAFYKTMTGAVESELSTRFDAELIKSEILSVLDERLAEVQAEVGDTRRAVDELAADGLAADGPGDEFEWNERTD